MGWFKSDKFFNERILLKLLGNYLAEEKQFTCNDWEELVLLLWDGLCLEAMKREEEVPRGEEGRWGRALGTWRLSEQLIFA